MVLKHYSFSTPAWISYLLLQTQILVRQDWEKANVIAPDPDPTFICHGVGCDLPRMRTLSRPLLQAWNWTQLSPLP